MFTQNTVTIVTAATGHPRLGRCLESVRGQTFGGVEHWVVVDGPEHERKVRDVVEGRENVRRARVMVLPHASGKERWNGHRIYAAASFLVNSEFVCFLDEDNWLEPEHVQSLVAAVRETPKATWAFALRNIVDGEGNVLARDRCESLGHLHHVFNSRDDFHIDTNCYLLHRMVAVATASVWYRPTRPTPGAAVLGQLRSGTGLALEPDNALCRMLLEYYRPAACSRRHTVNYVVGNRADSVQGEYFLHGNEVMERMYPDGMPWEK